MNDLRTITPKRDIARELARKYSTMTHDELDILEGILEPVKYGKGEMILTEGEVCRGISYIEKGLVRQFYNKNGKEVTEHLGVDHTIFMCIESLFKEEPSRLQVEALEATLVYILPKSKLEAAAIRTIGDGIMTGDLAAMSKLPDKTAVGTEAFLDAVAERI